MSRHRISTRLILAALVAALLTGCNGQPPPATPSSPPTGHTPFEWKTPEPPTPTEKARPTPLPSIEPGVWASWAFFDRSTGVVAEMGGNGTGTSTTESMIKVAIAAQYLRDRENAAKPPTDGELKLISTMLRDSDNDAAEILYRYGGRDQLLGRIITTCGLRNTTQKPGWWSETQMTPADAARLGACVANGKVCSHEWVTWLLGEMRSAQGVGRFGIIDAHPQDNGRPLAIKNGYQIRSDGWHINCLAIADFWTLAVMLRYPTGLGMGYGAKLCADVAAAVLPADPSPSATVV